MDSRLVGSSAVVQETVDQGSLAERVAALRWYHRMPLPGGIVTPGVSDAARIVSRLQLPDSLAGKTVLDVGAWDGYYSFSCAQRGAKRVLATDSFSWSGESWGSKDGFLLAREALGLGDVVDDQFIDVMDISPEKVGGTFDVVLLLGVIYHLRDPITALERVASVCDDLLIVETELALDWLPWPSARLYPERELNDDDTNWYAYNSKALGGLLRRVGFEHLDVVYRTPLYRRAGRAAKALVQQRRLSAAKSFRSHRVVIHARR
jgi:tRNA (mo5U34)-methyltransferase